jgi:uncharacterized protein YbjQ (UPF0145 family)
MPTCSICGKKTGIMGILTYDFGADTFVCEDCRYKGAAAAAKEAAATAAKAAADQQRIDALKQAASMIPVTTTHTIDGYYVRRYIGIESIEYVIGTGIFSELTTEVRDFFGARSSAFEKKLQTAKQQALLALKYRAAEQGANAIIGIDLDYSEFSGNRVALIINGTLVEIAPRPPKSK